MDFKIIIVKFLDLEFLHLLDDLLMVVGWG